MCWVTPLSVLHCFPQKGHVGFDAMITQTLVVDAVVVDSACNGSCDNQLICERVGITNLCAFCLTVSDVA